ncbi:hypothetical protein EGI22_07000 [Lacihabitans sp. LS3-19]|uniref:hypothetical protein n=1 Tax=Lacihabitans sp. LS3-19 TaxID=2487335 RepID=UPI0020CF29B6|nr:hypothetical protein [Lacihabitans sp. LS3-19]MCP9767655.1 hypothetical protein [Lacihabitans sp. LS3-19]
MKNILFKRSHLSHLLAITIFILLSVGFMNPILSGKTLQQSDTYQMHAVQSEIRKFGQENHGEYTGWTNSMFGGMPTYFVGGDYSEGVFVKVQPFIYNLFSQQGTFIFLYLLGAYLLLIALGVKTIPAIIGSLGYAFFSYNILIIEAGHLAKVYALAFLPIMVAGLVWGFRGKPWLGAAVFSLGLGLELNANHFQITYYSAFIIGVLAVFELVRAIKSKHLNNFLIASGLSLVLGLLVVGTNTSRLWTSTDYAKYTMRGGSDLKSKGPNQGLEKDYAFEWSYGKLESFSFLIPNFSGGGSGELDKDSQSFKTLTALGVDYGQALQFAKSLPTYWGDQQFVSGPTYSGAIILFLFILGLFFANERYKLPFLISGIICLFISWGSNLSLFNNILFDYLPYFNKFRAVSMILSLFQLCIVAIGALGLHELLVNKPSWEKFKKPLYISLGIAGGLSLFFFLLPGFIDFSTGKDIQFKEVLKQSFGSNQNAVNQLYTALLEDRESLFKSDALRSLVFILLTAGLLVLYVKNTIKNSNLVGGLLAILVLIDLWSVDKRYLNKDDFQPKPSSFESQFQQTSADLQILNDKSLSFRVIDVTSSPFTNAFTSVYHKSVGGYSAAKLSRFNDLIENQIAKNNMAVLNMLNTKYFIAKGQDGNPIAQQNAGALGNAWFVSEIKEVTGANAEMQALDSLNPAKTLVVEKQFIKDLGTINPSKDLTGTVTLTSYSPKHLEYNFESPNAQVVVFSEVFYKGNEDWISTIDGKPAPHFRGDYILRAMAIPAGKHKIEFVFDPVSVKVGQKYDRNSSIAWVGLVFVALFMHFRTIKNED